LFLLAERAGEIARPVVKQQLPDPLIHERNIQRRQILRRRFQHDTHRGAIGVAEKAVVELRIHVIGGREGRGFGKQRHQLFAHLRRIAQHLQIIQTALAVDAQTLCVFRAQRIGLRQHRTLIKMHQLHRYGGGIAQIRLRRIETLAQRVGVQFQQRRHIPGQIHHDHRVSVLRMPGQRCNPAGIAPVGAEHAGNMHQRFHLRHIDQRGQFLLAAVGVEVVKQLLVHLNKCPVLAQANTLRPEDADRLGINRQACLANLQILRDNPVIREKVLAIFAEAEPFVPSENVDAQLYNGFFSDADRAAMKIVLATDPQNLPALDITFADKRIEKLLFNYRARNFPGTLDENEQQRWLQHRRNVFTPEFLQAWAEELEALYQEHAGDSEKLALIKALYQYAQEIV